MLSIAITSACSESDVASDHAGSKSIFKALGLGRDRLTANGDFLVIGIAVMSAGLQQQNMAMGQLLLQTVYSLMDQQHSALGRLVYAVNHRGWHDSRDYAYAHHQQLAEGLHDLVKQKFGSDAIPTSQLAVLDMQQIQVSNNCTSFVKANKAFCSSGSTQLFSALQLAMLCCAVLCCAVLCCAVLCCAMTCCCAAPE